MPRPTSAQKTVLVMLAEPTVRELVGATLRQAGFFALQAADAAEALRLCAEVRPDLMLLDLDAEGGPREALLSRLLLSEPPQPCLLLSANPALLGNALRLAGPAASGLHKPFATQQLLDSVRRRLRSPLTRSQPAARGGERRLRHGTLELDMERRSASLLTPHGRRSVDLGLTELKLLGYLLSHADRVHSREDIQAGVWGRSNAVDLRTVDQNIRRLRRSFDRIGAKDLIHTVHGFGYRIADAQTLGGSLPESEAGAS